MEPWCESWFCQTYKEYQGLNPSHLVVMMIPFFVTVVVVYNLAVKPILHLIEERERRTSGARAEAADFEAKFTERLKAYETRLQDARQKASDERTRIRKSASTEEEAILSAARDDASKIVDDMRGQVAAERDRVRGELRKQAEQLAHELAEKALGREIGSTPAQGASRARATS